MSAGEPPVVTAELHLDLIADAGIRRILRQAAHDATAGPVWIVRADGTRIGAIVTVAAAGRVSG